METDAKREETKKVFLNQVSHPLVESNHLGIKLCPIQHQEERIIKITLIFLNQYKTKQRKES